MRREQMNCLRVLVVGSVILAGAQKSWADVIVFSNAVEFFKAAQIVRTETFDEFKSRTVLGSGSAVIGGIT